MKVNFWEKKYCAGCSAIQKKICENLTVYSCIVCGFLYDFDWQSSSHTIGNHKKIFYSESIVRFAQKKFASVVKTVKTIYVNTFLILLRLSRIIFICVKSH